tara:strand:- start:54 stop:287 length:234 start_codon:yes stop_codon:yes gene_type:complete
MNFYCFKVSVYFRDTIPFYSQKEIEMINNNNTLTEGELNSTKNKNIQENADQTVVDSSKSKEKDSFHRSLEAFSDCV